MRKLHSLALICLIAVGSAFGQVSSGDLIGTITDASGAAVPDTKVEARNSATGVVTVVQTNASGQYRFTDLLPGLYDVTVTAQGFTTASLKNVAVDTNKVGTANFTLQVGQIATTVEVTEAAAVIDTTTASIQSTFDSRASRDLPVTSIGLGSANLALLNAGVANNGGLGAGEGPSVGGQRPRNNNFMIEGIDNNNKTVTGSLIRFIPNDAVAEFTVLQNQMSAEFGHSSGGQFNTTIKSGTNQIHGSAFEYFQNRNLNAIDQLVQSDAFANGERPQNPRYDQNRFGGTFGGPIIKNKLFYFGDFEYEPVGLTTTPSAVLTPTSAGFAQLASIPGLSQNNLAIFKQYVPVAPTATQTISVSGQSIPVGLYPFLSPNYQNNTFAVASADYNISDRDQLRGRYIYNKLSQIDVNATLPAFYLLVPPTYYVATLSEYHNFSPNVINEFRLGYNRLNQTNPAGNFKFPGLDSFPDLHVLELGLQIGPDSNAPQFTIQNTYQLTNNLTWVKGAHTLKFGIDTRKYITPGSFTQRSRGDYEYSTLALYLEDLTPDHLAQRGIGNVVYYGDQIQFFSYVNDSWRVRPNLTLDLGLRHEYTTVPYSERLQTLNAIANVPGVLEFNAPQSQKKNFAPRVGIAYSPGSSGRTSIRAGFGMAYDVIYDNIGISALPPELKTTVDITNRGNPLSGAPNFLADGGISPNLATALTPSQARTSTASYIPDQKLPYSIQWNIGIQHVFAKDYTFEARYLGTRGIHLDVQSRINAQAVVTPNNSLPTYLQMPTQAQLNALPLTLGQLENEPNIVPRFANAGFTNPALVEDSPIGNSTYHGLALQLNRRFANGLQFVAAYTWSHLIDDSTADFNSTALTPRRPEDFQNMSIEKASSALDRRHRVTISAVYDAPWFRNSNWWMKNLVGNWTVAPIYTFESPEYVTVQSSVDSNLNGDSATDRVIINPSGTAGAGSSVVPLCAGGPCNPNDPNEDSHIVAYLATNPNARYIVAGRGAYANGGRNTLPGRPINNWDMNLLKNFALTERFRLQFSAQFYNLFNHPQFLPGFPDRVDAPPTLNVGPAVNNYLTPGTGTFNDPEAIYSSNPRNIQLALKLIF
jgi:hypothetical protein